MEKSASEVDAAVGAAVGRVQIVLVNQDDLANGWATPVPYNTIEISVAAPTVESVIGNSPDWLRLVFVHEHAHAHLSRAGGRLNGLRRGFGRLLPSFPTCISRSGPSKGSPPGMRAIRRGRGALAPAISGCG